jgi:hypothetical protein
MRVCPKCGYRDLPIWRNAWHKRFTDVTTLDSLKDWDMELAKKIEDNPSLYFDGLYNYHLSKRGYVVRILREHAISPTTVEEPHRELWHPPHHSNIKQAKLLEVKQ